MPTLLPADNERLRDTIGDFCAPYELSDIVLQTEYTRAAGDFDVTVVYLLRRLIGRLSTKIDQSNNEGYSISLSQRYQQAKELLDRWEKQTGMEGGLIGVGAISLGLDEPDDPTAW